MLSEVFPTNTSTNQRNLFKYFIKQFGCRLAQSGISISNSIIDYYFDWKKELNHFYVRFELDYDLLIALKKMKDENLGCGNFYYAPLNYLKPHKDSDDIDLVFSFYNNEWIRTRFFYSEKINTSDINWLNTYFEGDYLFFKIVSSFAPNEVENLSFDEFADKLKYAGLMKAKQPLIDKINEYPNLIVSQTFSKAWALAAVRIGVAYSNSDIISLLNKVKPPYNVSTLNQNAVVESLLNYSEFAKRKNSILEQKEWLIMQFSLIKSIIKIYPSDANFVLIETVNATKLYNELINKRIITRNRNNLIKNCIRITVGSQSENEKLIIALKELTV